jgi:hypothetical protein
MGEGEKEREIERGQCICLHSKSLQKEVILFFTIIYE